MKKGIVMEEIIINRKQLKEIIIEKNVGYEIKINDAELTYCFKIFLKDITDKIIIFSNGAIDPNKKAPPVYMRSSWIEDINSTCIFLDDPTTHKNNLRLGWGQGILEEFVLEKWADIIRELLVILNFKEKNTYFYGSSAGGFMSIYYSILIPKTTAIVNNPQTNVLNYLPPYVKKMLQYSYEINNVEDVPNKYMYRLNLVEAMKFYNNIPKKIYYLQNYLCSSDMEKHYFPFLNSLNDNQIELKGLCTINYFKQNLGHNPLPKNLTLRYIQEIIEGNLDFDFK